MALMAECDLKLSVVIPVFNERRTLPELLRRVLAVPLQLEVVVVDDGSSDGSREYLASIADERVTVFRVVQNRGEGHAVALGIRKAKGDVVLTGSGRGSRVRLGRIPETGCPICRGAEVVYGVRSWKGSGLAALPRRGANALMTAAANLLYGARLSDPLKPSTRSSAGRHRRTCV